MINKIGPEKSIGYSGVDSRIRERAGGWDASGSGLRKHKGKVTSL